MSGRGEFVKVPLELIEAGLSDEALGFVLRALYMAWQRGMTRQRSGAYGKPMPLSKQDVLALTRRPRADYARAFLAKLPPVALSQLGASWSLEGELVGVLGRGKCPALHVSGPRVSGETRARLPLPLPPAQRSGGFRPQQNAEAKNHTLEANSNRDKNKTEPRPPRQAGAEPTHIGAALREVLG